MFACVCVVRILSVPCECLFLKVMNMVVNITEGKGSIPHTVSHDWQCDTGAESKRFVRLLAGCLTS